MRRRFLWWCVRRLVAIRDTADRLANRISFVIAKLPEYRKENP